jgi:amino acid transporter
MDTTEAAEPSSQESGPSSAEKKYLTVRQAAFIGVGAMVGAGIFALLGAAGANLLVLILAIVAAGAVFVTFVFTTLIHEPASIVTLAGILLLSVALDYGWKHFHNTRTKNVQLAH